MTPKPEINWREAGRRIRELRGFDKNQAQFAAQIGVAQSYVSAMERGTKETGAAVLLSIARQYNVSIEWILTGKR